MTSFSGNYEKAIGRFNILPTSIQCRIEEFGYYPRSDGWICGARYMAVISPNAGDSDSAICYEDTIAELSLSIQAYIEDGKRLGIDY